jgi:hypothetical protein
MFQQASKVLSLLGEGLQLNSCDTQVLITLEVSTKWY